MKILNKILDFFFPSKDPVYILERELAKKGMIVHHIQDVLITKHTDVHLLDQTYLCKIAGSLSHYYFIVEAPRGSTIWRMEHDEVTLEIFHNTYTQEMVDWDVDAELFDDVIERLKSRLDPYVTQQAHDLGAAYGH